MQRQLVKKLHCGSQLDFLVSSIHRLFSTSLPPVKPPFAVEYLVKSCGLPLERAFKASKYISHLKSPTKPDSVLQFLRESGLSDADITRAVRSSPRLLCANLEIINLRIREAQQIGFSPSQIAQLVSLSPVSFRFMSGESLQGKIEFWRPFFGSLEGILSALKKAQYLLTISVKKVAEPNIAFLQGHCGVSPGQIEKMIVRAPALFTSNLSKLKAAAQKAEELGLSRDSGSFVFALQMTFQHSPRKLDAKIKNLVNIGFSKGEIESMIKKQPTLLTNSDERICSSIGFLTSEAGLDLASIALNPKLMALSLEKRIIPRHYVLKSLKSKGLCENRSCSSVMDLSEKRFEDMFVSRYKNIIPEVFEAYGAARAGTISLKGKLSDTPRDVA